MAEPKKDGTLMYCPHCEELQICKGLNPSAVGKGSGQRRYYSEHPDLQFFRRGRLCKECDNTFSTAEVNEVFLDELVELRDALAQIKAHAEAYTKEAQAAAGSLLRLTSSLNVLKALKMYQQTKGEADEEEPDDDEEDDYEEDDDEEEPDEE